jgi:valyl-tRNA synthetase
VQETRAVLAHVLETAIRALHPMMPFLTEELWARLPKKAGHAAACIIAPYPRAGVDGKRDEVAERELAAVIDVVTRVRAARAENDAPMATRLAVTLEPDAAARVLWSDSLRALAGAVCNAELSLAAAGTQTDASADTAVSVAGTTRVLVHGVVDLAKERTRLDREVAKLEKDLAVVTKKLGGDFATRAPADVVGKERVRKVELEAAIAQLSAARKRLG